MYCLPRIHAVMQSLSKVFQCITGEVDALKGAYRVIPKAQHIQTQYNLQITSKIAVCVLFLHLYSACIMGS